MIRKVYLDVLRNKLSRREYGWLLSRGRQFVLSQLSMLVGRPLCGPTLGTLVTNYRCNYRCTMCDLPERDRVERARGRGEMDTKAMRGVIEAFARLGTPGIGFTGGEPLLRSDIFELLAYTKQLGMVSHLNTNGGLLDESRVRAMFDVEVDSLNISLDGARKGTHDAIRGTEGAFERAVGAVQRTVAYRKKTGRRLRIKTVAVLQERNIDEVPEMVRLAADLGVDCIEFIPRQAFRTDVNVLSTDERFLEKVDAAVAFLRRKDLPVAIENSASHLRLFAPTFRNLSSPHACTAGYTSLAVDCYGDVFPCVPWYNWRRAVGNVNETDLAEFWRSGRYRRVRKETARCSQCTLNCQAELNILFRPLRNR